MAFSINHLSEYLSKQDFGPSMELTLLQTENSDQSLTWQGQELPWNGLSCLSIVCYALKMCSDSENTDIFDTIKRLNDLASKYNVKPRVSDYKDTVSRLKDVINETAWPPYIEFTEFSSNLSALLQAYSKIGLSSPKDLNPDYERLLHRHIREGNIQNIEIRREISETFVQSFLPKAQQFFIVPERNEHLASFIHFLLQILNSESHHIRYYDYGLGDGILLEIHKWSLTLFRGGLNFMLSVLGDTPFRLTDMEQVKSVLTEFKAVANDAGNLIYSSFFRTSPLNACQFLKHIIVLWQKVDLLKVKIEEYCVEFSKLHPLVNVNQTNSNAPDALLIIESLVEDLQNFTSNEDLTDDIEVMHQTASLHKELLVAQSFLKDANVPEATETRELKIQIRDAAFEVEYLLNSLVVGDFPISYWSIRLPMIMQKFKLIGKGLIEIRKVSGIEVLKVEENLTVENKSQEMVQTPEVVDEVEEVGFEDEMMDILDELTGGSLDLKFICIYGMPGLGKTTLAKRLYNHGLVRDRFDECAWCVASQTYQKRSVLIQILTRLRNRIDKERILEMEDESLILEEIYKTLFSRRYLIVIDDVWDSTVWTDLGRYFRNDRTGSRILFTTRIQDTAPINTIFLTPRFLSDQQCWELMEKKVFPNKMCPPRLQESGKRIAAKCNGLPLAVVVIAGILSNMAKEKHIWDKLEEKLGTYAANYCMEILQLSYNHLPDHLKLCFLYLGVFPKDVDISAKRLLRLWIAEGFVQKDGGKSQEQVAQAYLMDLINRSLVLVSEMRTTGGVKRCGIHNLLRDMCLGISKEENFLNLIETDHNSMHEMHPRLCVLPTAPVHVRPFSLYCRSFFGHISDASSCLPQMKRLTVMELTLGREVSHLNIFKRTSLFYLRYLVIDQVIPELVLENLVNLEVLCVNNTSHVDVSKIISKIMKLRHLLIKWAMFLTDCTISQPHNLRSLSDIHISSTKHYENLRCLPNLQKLKCSLSLLPDLSFLKELKSLEIKATYLHYEIPRYNQTISFPSTITKLTLRGTCLSWEMMSVVGRLPELLSLKLFGEAFVGTEWETKDYEFQKLEFLELVDLELEKWISQSEHFPRLHHLKLVICEKIREIPTELGDITTLHTIEVFGCSYGASISAVQVEQEQHENGNKDLHVIIKNERWSKEQLVFKCEEMNGEQFSNENKQTRSLGARDERQDRTSTVHTRIGCDYCGMFPIVGDRHKCKDCTEKGGYDLCGDCYSSTRSELPGRKNQKHTSEHEFELVTLK